MHPRLRFLKGLVPHSFIQRRELIGRLAALGLDLPPTQQTATALERCRADLWPEDLRRTTDWALVDVGANWGQFLYAVKDCGIFPRDVIAFEPLESLKDAAEIALRFFPKWRLVSAAVGEAPGETIFYRTLVTAFSSVLKPNASVADLYGTDSHIAEELRVPVVTLDQELAQVGRIGLLKIDVQGYELQALRGARETLKRTRAVLVEINYRPHYEGAVGFEELHAELVGAGFALHAISEPSFSSGVPLWADAVYVNANCND